MALVRSCHRAPRRPDGGGNSGWIGAQARCVSSPRPTTHYDLQLIKQKIRRTRPNCKNWGRPVEAHDAGECWWDLAANAESCEARHQCECDAYEPVGLGLALELRDARSGAEH